MTVRLNGIHRPCSRPIGELVSILLSFRQLQLYYLIQDEHMTVVRSTGVHLHENVLRVHIFLVMGQDQFTVHEVKRQK